MPSKQWKKKMYHKKYCQCNSEGIKAAARSWSKVKYSQNPVTKKASSKHYYDLRPQKRRAVFKNLYDADPDKKRCAAKRLYDTNPDKKRCAVKRSYYANPDKKRGAVKKAYYADPEKKRDAVKRSYYADPNKKRGAVKMAYYANPEKKKSAIRKSYFANSGRMKKRYSVYYVQNRMGRLLYFKNYYSGVRKNLRQARYNLDPPKPVVAEIYLRKIQSNILSDSDAKSKLIKVSVGVPRVSHVVEKTVCKLAAIGSLSISLYNCVATVLEPC